MTRTVVVTGGLGRSGRWIVDHLAGEDWDVLCVDQEHPGWEIQPRDGVDFRAADLTDAGQTFELLAEIDPAAVVHWAALPAPVRHAGGRVFETNVTAAYNVLVAAGQVGARVVWASSESAYGFAFAEETPLPDELPITEDHAMRPEDPYGVSKIAGEEVAKMVARRYDVPVVSIRPSWIQYPGEYNCLDSEDLAAGAGNCWSYVDVRDVATQVAAALESDVDGHEAVHAAAANNYLGRPTVEAVREYFGTVPEGCSLPADSEASALSVEKAGRLLDWEPAHGWRDAAEEAVESPTLAE
jgi:nucleoside-diphosphate-sugar epimerase